MLPWSLAFPSFSGYVILFMWKCLFSPPSHTTKIHPSSQAHFNGHFIQEDFPNLLPPFSLAVPWHLFSSIIPYYPAIQTLSLHILNYLPNNLERNIEMPKAVVGNCSSIFCISSMLSYVRVSSWILPVLCPSLVSFLCTSISFF